MTESAPQKEWHSAADLAEWLDLDGGAKAIHWMVYKGTAPRHYKIAGKLRFHRDDIAAWLAEREVKAS